MFLLKSLLSLSALLLAAQAATIPTHVRTQLESDAMSHTTGMTMPAHTKTHSLPAAATTAKTTHIKSPSAPSSPPNPSAYYSRSSRSSQQCTPFKTTFTPGSVASKGSSSSEPFVAVSPDGSWALGDEGLELYMERPKGGVKSGGGVNDVVADGATVNSTFTML